MEYRLTTPIPPEELKKIKVDTNFAEKKHLDANDTQIPPGVLPQQKKQLKIDQKDKKRQPTSVPQKVIEPASGAKPALREKALDIQQEVQKFRREVIERNITGDETNKIPIEGLIKPPETIIPPPRVIITPVPNPSDGTNQGN